MKKRKTLFVLADGSCLRFVVKREDRMAFDTIGTKEVKAPKGRDIVTDRPGRSHESANTARHAIEPRIDPHEQQKRAFVRQSSEDIMAQAEGFDHVVVIAPAKVLGDLRKSLNGAVRLKLKAITKDLVNVPDNQLARHLEDLYRP